MDNINWTCGFSSFLGVWPQGWGHWEEWEVSVIKVRDVKFPENQ